MALCAGSSLRTHSVCRSTAALFVLLSQFTDSRGKGGGGEGDAMQKSVRIYSYLNENIHK